MIAASYFCFFYIAPGHLSIPFSGLVFYIFVQILLRMSSPLPPPDITPPAQQFSGLTLLYLCAVGLFIIAVVFIFVKRQIMRMKSSSRRTPYTPIGQGASKKLKNEILLNLDVVAQIRGNYQPTFAGTESYRKAPEPLKRRMQAMDEVKIIDKELKNAQCILMRQPKQSFYGFLQKLKARVLPDITDHQINRLAFLYEWARHSPEPFGEEELTEFRKLVSDIAIMIRRDRDRLAAIQLNADDLVNGVHTPLLVTQKDKPSLFSRIFKNKHKETNL